MREHIEQELPPVECYQEIFDCENVIPFLDMQDVEAPASNHPPRRATYASEWPNPDLSIIDGGAFAVPSFPEPLLHEELSTIVLSLAEAKGAPPDYVLAGILSTAASLVGNARAVQAFDGWREPVALWSCVVGGPSAGKTPALDPAISILKTIEDAALPDHKQELSKWQEQFEVAELIEKNCKAEVKAAIKIADPRPDKPQGAIAPPEPVRPRRMISDITQERAGELLSQLPKGLCLFRDELAGLIAGCGRYGNDSDRQFFLEAWNGKPFTIDRVSKPEPILIDRLLLSIVGGIQPDRLNSLILNDDNDGLASRFLFVWPEPMPPVRPTTKYANAPLKRAFNRLDQLALQEREDGFVPAVIKLTDGANDRHQTGREWLYETFKDAPGLFGSFTGKIPGMVLRLAGIIDLLDWALGGQQLPPTSIDAGTIDRSWKLFESYFIPMAQRVYGDAGIGQAERNAKTIAQEIMARRELTINARTILRDWKIAGLNKAAQVDAALKILEEHAWIKPDPKRLGNKVGRPTKDHKVNPDLFSEF